MKRISLSIVVICLMVTLGVTSSSAAIFNTTGSVTQISAPASVVPGAVESNTQVKLFPERQDYTLATTLSADITATGTVDIDSKLSPGSIPAGTVISSYFLHFDTVGSDPSGYAFSPAGSVTFDRQILGVIVQNASLDATDALLGSAGTSYPASAQYPLRGLILSEPETHIGENDSISVSCDRLTVNRLLSGALEIAQIRVITGDQPCARVDIVKYTNGQDANTPPGPYIAIGQPVNWTYVVTNTGVVPLSSVTVTDDKGVSVSCPKTSLAVGESMTCTATGTAVAGQYANVGTVVGTPPDGPNVSDSDPSHYFGSWNGRTPGYWKNKTGEWPAFSFNSVVISPSTMVAQVFAIPTELKVGGILDLNGDGADDTLLDALGYGGGKDLAGKSAILLRAAVAGFLNEQSFGASYPPYSSTSTLVAAVNTALATKNVSTIITLASALDNWNNGIH